MHATIKDHAVMRQLDRNDVHLLWHADFWDGPVNGLCQYAKKKYWFEMLTDGDDDSNRRYVVVELSAQQLADEEYWHELFRQKVGTHCDYGEPRPEVRAKELHREFYESFQKRSKPDYSNNPVIGWFALS